VMSLTVTAGIQGSFVQNAIVIELSTTCNLEIKGL
jgi:hypothetical protein